MELDSRGKAAEAIERRARQRQAAAEALAQLTPEAIAAEEERQRRSASTEPEYEPFILGQSKLGEASLGSKLAEAVQPILDGSEETYEGPQPVGIGRAVVQWVLVPAEGGEGYELALQVQVDEQPPGGVVLEISQEMLAAWSKGAGLQQNRVEHKKFAAGIIEKTIELAAHETGNALIYALEELMLSTPTKTQVGDSDEVAE